MSEQVQELKEENKRLREALEKISDPIKFFKNKAQKAGTNLCMINVIKLSEDPIYLQGIAKETLKEVQKDAEVCE